MSRWEGELQRAEKRKMQEALGSSDPSSPWYRGPHETRLIERGEAFMAAQDEARPKESQGVRCVLLPFQNGWSLSLF